MRSQFWWLVSSSLLFSLVSCPLVSATRHYVYVGRDRERIHDLEWLDTRAFEGAQIMYPWRLLEPKAKVYDFSAIEQDLAFLTAHGKRLFVQLQDASFSPSILNVPQYLLEDARFHGGAAEEYDLDSGPNAPPKPDGWVARRWDPAVRERFERLLMALGRQFDGRIAGINLPETAVDLPERGPLCPAGFTPSAYRDGIVAEMRDLKKAFPRTITMQYANFMPGEWLPVNDRHYLRTVYAAARRMGVGIGGPDLLPDRPGQMHHSYPLISAAHGIIPTGIAVQEGNYDAVDPRTHERSTIAQLIRFARENLKVTYLFWFVQEPYFSRDLVPYLRRGLPPARSASSGSGLTVASIGMPDSGTLRRAPSGRPREQP